PASNDSQALLGGNQVPYQWPDLEVDAEARQLVQQLEPETPQLPLVLFPDGSRLEEPTSVQLAQKIGMQTRAQKPFYDLIVVGAGPAGLAAAVYGASEGL